MLVIRPIWRYMLWRGWGGLAGKGSWVRGMLGHMRSYSVWVRWPMIGIACRASFYSSSLSWLYGKEVPRWSNIDSTCWRFGGWGRLVLWGSWCWDFRLIDQTAKEQEGCHSKSIVEKSSCWGHYVGGWGLHKIPLPSSFQLLKLDFLLLILCFLISLYFFAIAWLCIVIMIWSDWYYDV